MLVIDPADIHIGKLSMLKEQGKNTTLRLLNSVALMELMEYLKKLKGFQ